VVLQDARRLDGLWALLGLVVLGTVIYIAVRLALGGHRHDRGHDPEDHDGSGHCC